MAQQSTLRNVGLFILQRPTWFMNVYIAYQIYLLYKEATNPPKKPKGPERPGTPGVLEQEGGADDQKGKKKKQRVDVDIVFFNRLWTILKIAIPGVSSKEFAILILHSVFLVLRTYLSIVVASLDGLLVKTLVTADGKGFVKGLGMWFGISIPAIFTNSMIKYLQSSLALNFRSRLTRYVHDSYMDSKTYYKVSNLDNRLENADQLITTDIAKFCDALAELYGNIGKPLLDIQLFSMSLHRGLGASGMGTLWWAYFASAALLRIVTPNFGKMRAIEAKLEGEFRFAHSRIITNAEEIAFYGGENTERTIVDSRYLSLIKHVNRILQTRVWFHIFEDFLLKYLWSTIGLVAQSVPVFFPDIAAAAMIAMKAGKEGSDSAAHRTERYVTNKKLMMSLGDAGSRLMYSYKDLVELAGYTQRVHEMLVVFKDMKKENYEKIMISPDYSLKKLEGKISLNPSGISLAGVPIVSPNGDLLSKDVTFSINHGDHLMVTGPNGCGKTSLVRIIAELWPIFRGNLTKPSVDDIFYVPQRPYLSIGNLRDQVIYPDTKEDMIRKGITDNDLLEILKAAHLAYIPEREGGWETVKEWKDVFSGGEKQRIGLSRLFYKKAKFAFLDECTSAVSTDVEGLMYAHAKELGISLITVSHRPSLFKYHKYLIKFDGEGGWAFSQLDSDKELLSIQEEIKSIKDQLDDIPRVEARLADIRKELRI